MFDGFAREFDFMFQLELDWLQVQATDDFRMQRRQKSVLESRHFATSLFDQPDSGYSLTFMKYAPESRNYVGYQTNKSDEKA
jgi:hypothetical protein